MKSVKMFALLVAAGMCFAIVPSQTQAQVAVTVGPPPNCPYGYYDVPPYDCAPYGYYGPEWFNSGVFVGVGPWFHGHDDWHGYVDNRYDWHNYHGARPHPGDRPEAGHEPGRIEHFKGNEVRDGRGHAMGGHR